MKNLVILAAAVLFLVAGAGSVADAHQANLDAVNKACSTSYGCGLCHVDPAGGGALTSSGQKYLAAGSNPCYFCPTSASCGGGAKCTDADNDGYAIEGGKCGPVDCNDSNPTVHPHACDILNDGIDQNCDGKDRTKGKPCP